MKRFKNKKVIYLLLLLVISLIVVVITPTYAKFPSSYTTPDDIVGLSFNFDVGITNIEEYEQIVVTAKSYEVFNVKIENTTSDTMYYGIWYKMNNPSKINDNIRIARLYGTDTMTSGSISGSNTKTIAIIISNNSNETIKVDIGVGSSITGTSDIEYLNDKKLITGEYSEMPNSPKLDSGLIPVYYDKTGEVWRKADSNNSNYTWYDYDDKKWANAILVSDSTKRTTYLNSAVGTVITDADITAFYVWIPRYKYRVWNITRQVGGESNYAYPAYTEGIDIKFETGSSSTGNVICTYNQKNISQSTTLSDTCVYNGTTTITTSSGSTNYSNAWYTHPAFTFGSEQLQGIWVGKFETSGTATAPTIIPDVISLGAQTVSAQFTTAKLFQGYGLSSSIDAHMITNTEWASIAYLTHSHYGRCTDSTCMATFINNSTSYYTGRSSGGFALDGVGVTYGSFNYKGYQLNNDGKPSSTKNESSFASTTGNITGVYDMVGARWEYVMGNSVDSSYAFYPNGSGTSWNGATTLASKYYNLYSYVDSSTGTAQEDYNRARLGDATAETVGAVNDGTGGWKPGIGIAEVYTSFVKKSSNWFCRGGTITDTGGGDAGVFNFCRNYGGAYDNGGFRSALA